MSVRPPRYTEIAADPALAPWVACFWSMTAEDATAAVNRVLPDGCADIIVDLGARLKPYVVGTMRTALPVPLAGHVEMFGVRFRPGAALPFLDVPLSELTDRRVGLDALWGGLGATLGGALDELPAGDPRPHEARAERVATVLRSRLGSSRARTALRDAELASRAVALLRRARGSVGVGEVSRAMGIGERRLERAFERTVGISPKFLARVVRFRIAVRELERRMRRREPLAGAQVAFAAGYADQPHFVREFRALAGVTPTEYVAERRVVGFVQAGEGERP